MIEIGGAQGALSRRSGIGGAMKTLIAACVGAAAMMTTTMIQGQMDRHRLTRRTLFTFSFCSSLLLA